jgi:hypothetical protein
MTYGCFLIICWNKHMFYIISKYFAKAKTFAKQNFVKFRENCANFRIFSLLGKMKYAVFVSTLVTRHVPGYAVVFQ